MSRTVLFRGLFVASMVAAIVVCATVAFMMIRDLQLEIGRQTYESIAASALNSAKAITRRKIQAAMAMEIILSNTYPDADQWPMIALNGYYLISNEVGDIASDANTSMQIGLLVLVEPGEPAYAFENHTKQYYKDQGYPEDAGATEAGFGIRRADKNSTTGYSLDRTGEYSTYGSRNKILVPVLDHSTWNSGMLMYDAHVSSTAIDSIINCSYNHRNDPFEELKSEHSHYGVPCHKPLCSVVTGFRMKDEDVISLIYKPIYPQHDQDTLVGMIGLSVNFKDVLYSVIPDYFEGIHAVLSTHTRTADHSTIEYDEVTYDIFRGWPQLKGPGDLHSRDYDKYGRSIVLNDFNTDAADAVIYTLTIYPSSFSQYSTGSPAVVAAGLTAVILACCICFFLYDYLMRRESKEQKTVLDMKRRFVRFISHEIRTPLNTVCMGIELLESEIKSFQPAGKQYQHKGSMKGHPRTNTVEIEETSVKFWHDVTQDIKENAAGAVGILDDLLNYDKVETGQLHIEANVVNIVDVVEKTTKRFKVQAVNKQIELTLRVHDSHEDHLSTQSDLTDLMVMGDSMRITQVIGNCISNSLKFTPAGGSVQVSVRFCKCHGGKWQPLYDCDHKRNRVKGSIVCGLPVAGSVTIEVTDTGAGMTESQTQLVFKEGVQFDANKLQAGGGSGLGLCIAKGIIDRHNGVITAHSDGKGKGATFSIELPLYDMGRRGDDGNKSSKPIVTGAKLERLCSNCGSTCSRENDLPNSSANNIATFNGLPTMSEPSVVPVPSSVPDEIVSHRILVVEDVASSRKMLIRLLERAGHTCIPAGDGREAIEAIQKCINTEGDIEEGETLVSSFDIILMDYEMPICNGPDATEEIRRLGYQGLIFGVTGNLLKEDVDYFLSKGADDVLPKPVTLALIKGAWEVHQLKGKTGEVATNVAGERTPTYFDV